MQFEEDYNYMSRMELGLYMSHKDGVFCCTISNTFLACVLLKRRECDVILGAQIVLL